MMLIEGEGGGNCGRGVLIVEGGGGSGSSGGGGSRVDLYNRRAARFKMAADSAVETCPTQENADSRKRPLDTDAEDVNCKKSNCSAGGNDVIYHFKILVPSVAAGAIIGKGGETIAQLQKETNARVKMSKANDFYPGTTERVCLISGNIDSIMEALDFITYKIREKPDLSGKIGSECDAKIGDREKQVKILVPNTTAGMIIGKGGSYIKQLKEESGAYVQISQKAKDQSLQERCITVMGDVNSNKKACAMILAKVQEDPQSGSSLNISYADISGPVANYNPTGSPFAQSTSQQPYVTGAGLIESSGLAGITLTINLEPNSSPPQAVVSQVVNAISVALGNTGYPELAKAEISTAISTLGKYRMLGVCLTGNSPPTTYVGITTMDGAQTPNGVFGPIGGTTARTVLELALEPFRHTASGPNSPPHINNNTFATVANHDQGDKGKEPRKVEMEIAEAIVGAILGPGGRSLIEIQQLSGAVIQISKKGIYAPGTRNRVVAISGYQNSVNTAQYLIEQRIKDEEIKRTRQNQLLMLH
ncbi:RNA-binding protein Nova-1 isoform X2 [Cimex lectularius]|uniref:K Homology domain-containing protein n=1 Tax=Cimex lectularius TaxID=79782 RepID=A0A8I6TKZ6_CIMLE|nr:RNA-binding protein Nova-1 isoform X2 [Cimex lectularius]